MHRRRTSSRRTAMDWNNASCLNFKMADRRLQRLLCNTVAPEIRLTYGGGIGKRERRHLAWNGSILFYHSQGYEFLTQKYFTVICLCLILRKTRKHMGLALPFLFQEFFFLFICVPELQRPQFQRAHARAPEKKIEFPVAIRLLIFTRRQKIERAGDCQLDYQAVARVSGNTSQHGGPCV